MKKFSPKVKDAIFASRDEAIRLGHDYIGTEHILLGIINTKKSMAAQVLVALNVNLKEIKEALDKNAEDSSITKTDINFNHLPLNKAAEKVLKKTFLEAKMLNSNEVSTEHLLLSILKHNDNLASNILNQFKVDYETYKSEFQSMIASGEMEEPFEEIEEPPKPRTPLLDSFGYDITKLAEASKLDPIIGRKNEIKRLIQVLSCHRKNSAILIGEYGVGKKTIIEGLAQRIVLQKNVPKAIYNKRIITLNMKNIYQIRAVIAEILQLKDVILFIHNIVPVTLNKWIYNTFNSPSILKSRFKQSDQVIILSFTPCEYSQFLKKDNSIQDRFQEILIHPPAPEEAITILQKTKQKYEDFHNVTYSDEAIAACVHLSTKYLKDTFLPDKAIDILDEAGAFVHLKNTETPVQIKELEKKIDTFKKEKNKAVKNGQYEQAADLRDYQSKVKSQLGFAVTRWRTTSNEERFPVEKEDIVEVIALITGIPIDEIN